MLARTSILQSVLPQLAAVLLSGRELRDRHLLLVLASCKCVRIPIPRRNHICHTELLAGYEQVGDAGDMPVRAERLFLGPISHK